MAARGGIVAFLLTLPASLHAELIEIGPRGGLADAYFVPHDELDRIDAYLILRSGAFDADGPEGLSHYLEHLVWLHSVGADDNARLARDTNAWTDGLTTGYFLQGRPDRLEHYLATLAKTFEPPAVDGTFMRQERDIVRREYDYRVSEDPLYPVLRDLEIRLFGTTGRGRSTIGTPESIAALTPEAAKVLHSRTHVPANAALIVVGKTDRETVEPLVQKYFGSLQAGEPPPSREAAPFEARREIVETTARGLASSRLIYAKRIRLGEPIAKDRLQMKLDLLHAILDSTLEGSLAKPLRFDAFIANRFSLRLSAIEPGEVLLSINAWPDEGISLPVLMMAFEDELRTIADAGVPASTFDRIKKKQLSSLEKFKGKRDRALGLLIDQMSIGAEPIGPETYIVRYGATTHDDINALVQALIGPGAVAAAFVSPAPSN